MLFCSCRLSDLLRCSELERCHNDKLELENNTKVYMAQLRQLTAELQARLPRLHGGQCNSNLVEQDSEQQKQELFELYHSMSTENSELESRASEVDVLTDEAAETIQQSRNQLRELAQRLHASEAVKAQQAVDIAGFESHTARQTSTIAAMERVGVVSLWLWNHQSWCC